MIAYDTENIKKWIIEALVDNEAIGLFHKVKYRFNNRMSKTAGYAYVDLHEVELSGPLWRASTIQQQETTVKHEVCHLVAHWKYGHRGIGHGELWQGCMARANQKAEQYHSIAIPTKRAPHLCLCNCKKYYITDKLLRHINNGAKHRCRKCNEPLKPA